MGNHFSYTCRIRNLYIYATSWELKDTNLVFYVQDWEKGKNVTNVSVAGVINGTKSSVLSFGTIMVTDDALAEGPERHSKEVARGHGIYINSALDGSDLHLVLEHGISGTGFFRFARGFAILETVYLDVPTLNAVLKYNVTVLHY